MRIARFIKVSYWPKIVSAFVLPLRLLLSLSPVLLLALSLASWANATDIDQKTLDEAKKKFPHAIADILQKAPQLPQDTTVFHWSSLGLILNKAPAKDSNDAQIQEYLKAYTSRYWVTESGDGLYFAQDPLSSKYAGTVLLVITIKKGTRFYDDGSSQNTLFSEEAIPEFEKAGCDEGSLFGMYNPISSNCETVRKAVAQVTNLKFYTYDYTNNSIPHFCKAHHRSSALVVFDATAFVPGSAAVFDPRLPVPKAFEKAPQKF